MTELAIANVSPPPVIHNTPIGSSPRPLLIRDIIRIVAAYYRLSPQEITGRSRRRPMLKPRYMAIYLAHKLTGKSSPFIGRYMGGRDHTTILAALGKMEGMMEGPSWVAFEYQYLHDMIVAEYGL
jgi:chromosomal replication initiator protein